MKEKRWNQYTPVGISMKMELKRGLTGLFLAVLYSFSFLLKYMDARSYLFEWSSRAEKVIIRDAKIKGFYELLEGSFDGFLVFIVIMAGLIIYHYAYHYQGSKSIYLMRRLLDPLELHRRCLVFPIVSVVTAVITALILWVFYYGIYLFFTPQQCLPL